MMTQQTSLTTWGDFLWYRETTQDSPMVDHARVVRISPSCYRAGHQCGIVVGLVSGGVIGFMVACGLFGIL